MIRRRSKRKELTQAQKAVIVDRVVGQRQPLQQLKDELNIPRSTSSFVVKGAYKRKRDEIEGQGLLVTEEDIRDWGTNDLIEPQLLANTYRSGRPRALSEAQIDEMIAYATSSKAQRLKPWHVIAFECGHGRIARSTIWKYFKERGYVRAKPKKKPLLTERHKADRVTTCTQLKQSLRTGSDILIAIDECKCTAGVEGSNIVTRTKEELWHDDCVDPGIEERTGLLFFGIIGRNFRGKCYIFDPEDPKDRQRVLDDYRNEVQPQLDALLLKYKEDLERYEWLTALKNTAPSSQDKRVILTGRKPTKPTMRLFPFRNDRGTGVDWYRYLYEVINPILAPELNRFINNKDPWCLPLLIQDGAPPHSKCVEKGSFRYLNCELLRWPANSPDLNPIEHIWDYMRRWIANQYGYLKADQVRSVWHQAWDAVPMEYINWSMDHLFVVIERCLAQGGDNKYNG